MRFLIQREITALCNNVLLHYDIIIKKQSIPFFLRYNRNRVYLSFRRFRLSCNILYAICKRALSVSLRIVRMDPTEIDPDTIYII